MGGGDTNGQDTPTTWVHNKRVKTLYGCAEMSIRYFSFFYKDLTRIDQSLKNV